MLECSPVFGIEDARRKLEAWKEDYNTVSPHGSFGNMSPVEYLLSCQKGSAMQEENQEGTRLHAARY